MPQSRPTGPRMAVSHQSEAQRLPKVRVWPRQKHRADPTTLGLCIHMSLAFCINIYLLLDAEVTTADKTDSAPVFTSLLFLSFPQLRMRKL